jgi:hypothetical protein
MSASGHDETSPSSRSRPSPVVAIGVTQVIAWVLVGPLLDAWLLPGEGVTRTGESVSPIAVAIFAPLAVLAGAGYAALTSGHENPIPRTFLAFCLYISVLAIAGAGLMLIDELWVGVAPLLAVGVLLAVVMPAASSARMLFRVAAPTLTGGLMVALRNLADAYWIIPTPDWTMTILAALVLGLSIVNRFDNPSPHPQVQSANART